jgi:hypothetical protein
MRTPALLALALAAASASPALAQSQVAPTAGRYVMVFSPRAERNTFLLDTATGRTWQLTQFTDAAGQPLAWVPLAKDDGPPARMVLSGSQSGIPAEQRLATPLPPRER